MRKIHIFISYLLLLSYPAVLCASEMDDSFSSGKTSAGELNPSTSPTDPFVVPQYSDQDFNDAKAKGESYQSDPSKVSVDAETEMSTNDSGKFLKDSFANRPDPCEGMSSSVERGNYNCNIKTTVWFDIGTVNCSIDIIASYDFTADPSCLSQPSCNSGGVVNVNTDKCELAASGSCSSGYSYNTTYNTCTTTPTCSNGGSVSGGQCVLAATQNSSTSCSWVCSAPYQGCAPQWNNSVGGMICFFGPPPIRPCSWNDPWNGGWSNASYSCSTTYWYTCPSGYTLSGTTCYAPPSCTSGGSFNSGINLCDAGASFTCVSGYTLSGTTCQSSPICSGATSYDINIDKCTSSSCLYVGGVYGNYVQNSSTVDNCTPYSGDPANYTLQSSICIDSACRNFTPPGVDVCPSCWATQNTYFTDVQRESTTDSCARQ